MELDKLNDKYVFHKGSSPKKSKNIVLFADDPIAIEGPYGGEEYLLAKDQLIAIPQWVQEYAEKYYKEELGDEYQYYQKPKVDPDNIVDSADVWDDPQFVSKFWQENEAELLKLRDKGFVGFKTSDGAVVFPGEDVPTIPQREFNW